MKSFSLSLSQIIFLLNRSFLIAACQVVAMSAVFFGLAVVVAEARFGSLDAGWAYFSGTRVLTESSIFRGNFDPSQQEVTLNYTLRNLDDVELTIAGATASCSCTVTETLPQSIPARGVANIQARVKIDPKRSGDDLRGEIRVYTNHHRNPEILLSYVLKPSVAASATLPVHFSAGG